MTRREGMKWLHARGFKKATNRIVEQFTNGSVNFFYDYDEKCWKVFCPSFFADIVEKGDSPYEAFSALVDSIQEEFRREMQKVSLLTRRVVMTISEVKNEHGNGTRTVNEISWISARKDRGDDKMIDYKRLEGIRDDACESLNLIRQELDLLLGSIDDFNNTYMSETDDALNECINLGLVPGARIILNDGTRYAFIGYCLGGSRLRFLDEYGDNHYMMCQNQVEAHKRKLWHLEDEEAEDGLD